MSLALETQSHLWLDKEIERMKREITRAEESRVRLVDRLQVLLLRRHYLKRLS